MMYLAVIMGGYALGGPSAAVLGILTLFIIQHITD